MPAYYLLQLIELLQRLGDPEMIPVYVKTLLPLFCHSFQSTMIQSVKRSSLSLIKKIVHYLHVDLLTQVATENKQLVSRSINMINLHSTKTLKSFLRLLLWWKS